jgi:arsenical pump membrane protein
VLPISNPANLVVYGSGLPPLLRWLKAFLIPSICSIAATYVALRWMVRRELRGEIQDGAGAPPLSPGGKRAAWSIAASAVVLMAASALGCDLGLPTCAAALLAMLAATRFRMPALRETVSGVSWSVLPLVAGLFVLMEGLDRAGASAALSHLLTRLSGWPPMSGAPAAAIAIAAVSNVMNNLPAGLLAAGAIGTGHIAPRIRDAVLIGVDLGPNLSVTGSLATILWLIALRREGISIGGWRFLKMGAVVMPPALLAATAAAAWLSR